MKQKQHKEKEQKKTSSIRITHMSYNKNYEVVSKDDKKHYKSDNVSFEIIEYKL